MSKYTIGLMRELTDTVIRQHLGEHLPYVITLETPYDPSIHDWCKEHIGASMMSMNMELEWVIDPDGLWETFGRDIYFRTETDAFRFKISWL